MPLARSAVDLVMTFARQAGIALELAEHRHDAERQDTTSMAAIRA